MKIAHRVGGGLVAIALIAAASSARAQSQSTSQSTYRGHDIGGFYRGWHLDLNLEGGAGAFFGKTSTAIGFGRVRSGVMLTGWPVTMALGVTFEVNNVSLATYGIQYEFTHIASGGWFQLGATIDGRANFGGQLAAGWSVVGLELQVRGYDEVRPAFAGGYGVGILAKLRVPLGWMLFALSHH